ncbi:hypothetical protein KAU32_04285 [bacterium]|nr:hypothetical protein [bacterium]
MKIFKTSKKRGIHWDNLQKAIRDVKKLSLEMKGDIERNYEDKISGALSMQFEKSFIDQRNTQQVMTRISLFDHDHRPDMSIGNDGVAIEVKVIKGGSSFREAIGQSIFYRLGYRFVLVIWIDVSKNKHYRALLKDKESSEYTFVKEFENDNIFCIVK